MFLFSSRLRRWVVLSMAAPLAGRGLQLAAMKLAASRGPSPAVTRLAQVGSLLRARRKR